MSTAPTWKSPLQKKEVALNLKLHRGQAEVDSLKARFLYLLCGRRWGKTIYLLYRLLKACERPSSTVWYVAPVLKQAKDIAWSLLQSLIPPEMYQKAEGELKLVFPNNSQFYIKGSTDPDCRRGPTLAGLAIDEAQDFDPLLFEKIFRPLLIGATGNSTIAGTMKWGGWFHKDWLLAHAGKLSNAKAVWYPSETNDTIPKSEWENFKNDLKAKGLMHIWHEEFICNPFDDSQKGTGLKFHEFTRTTHVAEPFVFPSNYRVFRGMDWGTDAPTACLWAAVSPEGTPYIYDEYLQANRSVEANSQTIKEKTGNVKVEATVLGPDCWRNESDMKSIASKFYDVGIKPLMRGARENKAGSGADTVKNYLRPANGNKPKLFIFPNCIRLIETLESLRWTDKRGDDITEALRYLLVFLSRITWQQSKAEEKPLTFSLPVISPGVFVLNYQKLFKQKPEAIEWNSGGYIS